MEEVKKCQQCGELKFNANFRKYYGAAGSYRTCLDCEKLNTRRKYLANKSKKGTITGNEIEELESIDKLYGLLEASGLRPPRVGLKSNSNNQVLNDLNAEIQRRTEALEARQLLAQQRMLEMNIKSFEEAETGTYPVDVHQSNAPSYTIPAELTDWLIKDLTGFEPEQLQDEIAEYLTKKYRPQTGLDEQLSPVYDDTHRDALNAVLKKFDEYEDNYDA